MTIIYFVRHAHSLYTPDEMGRPLSEQGLCDADKLTKLLSTEAIDIVISSPYKRAIQTVEGVANRIGKDVHIHSDFRERLLSKEPVENFKEAITKVWTDPSFSFSGGESNIEAQKRGVEATLKVIAQYEGKRIVIGTHGNLMVLIMQYFDERYNLSFWEKLAMPDVYKLEFKRNKLILVERLWGES
ncbi:histidine phosphatase family protein [Rummeliibacillus pycnus]|uniref:histidine phosphatase family protein n=1 Tax=Rummeliibacillus pycnus TaxID=101070 RepID=UPI000C9A0192|nr:histidine phosphatase family protein [Rummeliibacillus pycnus]